VNVTITKPKVFALRTGGKKDVDPEKNKKKTCKNGSKWEN